MLEEFQIGRKKLQIVRGDITDERTHALVIPLNSVAFSLDTAIMRKGGERIYHERAGQADLLNRQRERKPLSEEEELGLNLITSGGNLEVRHIIHSRIAGNVRGQGRFDGHTIKIAVAKALDAARGLKLESVSIPLLNNTTVPRSGNTLMSGPISAQTALQGTFEGIREHLKARSSLQTIRLVMYEKDTFKEAVKQAAAFFGNP